MEYMELPLWLYTPPAPLLCHQHQNKLQMCSDDLLYNNNDFTNLKYGTKMHGNSRSTYYILNFLLETSSTVLKHVFYSDNKENGSLGEEF